MAEGYKYNRFVNKKIMLLGIDMREVIFLLMLLFFVVVFVALLGRFGIKHWSISVICLSAVIAAYILLRQAAKEKHTSFLFSFIGFVFFQPKKIKAFKGSSYENMLKRNGDMIDQATKNKQKS